MLQIRNLHSDKIANYLLHKIPQVKKAFRTRQKQAADLYAWISNFSRGFDTLEEADQLMFKDLLGKTATAVANRFGFVSWDHMLKFGTVSQRKKVSAFTGKVMRESSDKNMYLEAMVCEFLQVSAQASILADGELTAFTTNQIMARAIAQGDWDMKQSIAA